MNHSASSKNIPSRQMSEGDGVVSSKPPPAIILYGEDDDGHCAKAQWPEEWVQIDVPDQRHCRMQRMSVKDVD